MYPETENKSLGIYGLISNRCELFYKIAHSVQSDKTPRITSPKAIAFYNDILAFSKMTNGEMLRCKENGVIPVRTYTTRTEELIQYLASTSKKNSFLGKIGQIPIIRNIIDRLSPKAKQNKEIYGYLASKYETPQSFYKPKLNETILSETQPVDPNIIKTREASQGLDIEK